MSIIVKKIRSNRPIKQIHQKLMLKITKQCKIKNRAKS